ncbi:MAG TPA: NADH-quinone oxidoreductase subunit M, partial [Gammaproteobacteria bacterium]
MTAHFPILSVLLWLPIIGGLVVLVAGRVAPTAVRWLALLFSLMTFAISIPLWTQFDTSTASMQFVERVPWIPALHSTYYLGVDG